MSSFASFVTPFFSSPHVGAGSAIMAGAAWAFESASFNHAVIALAAKLAVVDGAPNKAEYAAFEALFVEGGEVAQARSLFLKRVSDSSTALQYARQIAAATVGKTELHREIFTRLLRVATADATLNAAELELLRAVATVFQIDRACFRSMIAQTMVPTGASPYEILGISSRASDQELREHYMARVQMLHPDRYHAAGASAETIAVLSDQLAVVNAAYQAVQKLRAKKAPRSTTVSEWWNRRHTKGARAAVA